MGNGFKTDALIYGPHFQGVMPAPQTVWPPGYAIILALLSHTGLELTTAGFILNLVTHALAGVMMLFILLRMGITRNFAAICALCFYLMANPWLFAVALLTEPVFTTLLLAAMLALPNPLQDRIWKWLLCGVLIAMAIYLRYSAVFFAIGMGSGMFSFLLLTYSQEHFKALVGNMLKLAALLFIPIIAFLYLMYDTWVQIGSLDRYSGSRVPLTVFETLYNWAIKASQLMGFDAGRLMSETSVLALFIALCSLAMALGALFFLRKLHKTNNIVDYFSVSYFRLCFLVVTIHGLVFAIYLTVNSINGSPLEIIFRYLYQVYPGVYAIFCFMLYSLLQHSAARNSGKPSYKITTAIVALAAIYTLGQINQIVATRSLYFHEAKTASAVMQTKLPNDSNFASYIKDCFKKQNSDQDTSSIWSTHGQHIYIHTGVPTITHADIYTHQPFDEKLIVERINDYNIKMFVFVNYLNNDNETYNAYMNGMKAWLSKQNYTKVPFLDPNIGKTNSVVAYSDCI